MHNHGYAGGGFKVLTGSTREALGLMEQALPRLHHLRLGTTERAHPCIAILRLASSEQHFRRLIRHSISL